MPTTTNNMGLKIPTAGETDYATSVSDSFNAIDGHDHSSSKGTQIITAGIADSAVTTAKINNGALANSSAGRAKMADGFLSADAEGRAKMADGFITQAKRAALGQQISDEFTFSTTSTTETDVTDATVTITSTGRPVVLSLVNGSSGGSINISGSFTVDSPSAVISVYEGATLITESTILISSGSGSATSIRLPASAFSTIIVPTAAAHTYKLVARVGGANMTIEFSGCKLIAYEL